MQYCKYKGGHLAEILDENDQLEINLFLIEKDPTSQNGFWIGLSDLVDEGHWIWMASGLPVQYKNWEGGEPNNINGKEHFGHINLAQHGRQWNDCPNENGHPVPTVCDNAFYGICQNITTF